MAGKLIVLEGLDGSGKSTQLALLPAALAQKGVRVRTISFPDYNDPSSTLVKMYLNGEFGTSAQQVNAYAASIFYAADRYASFVRYWREAYQAGEIILCGRYVSSNAMHQASKLPRAQWGAYMDWLYELEFERIGIPKPDLTLYLDMPREVADRLITDRYAGDASKKDVHERDFEYMQKCRDAADYAVEHLGWTRICCAENGMPLDPQMITQTLVHKILQAVQ